MEKYKFKQVIVRMRYNTLLRIKKQFPAKPNESLADYFERIAEILELKYGL